VAASAEKLAARWRATRYALVPPAAGACVCLRQAWRSTWRGWRAALRKLAVYGRRAIFIPTLFSLPSMGNVERCAGGNVSRIRKNGCVLAVKHQGYLVFPTRDLFLPLRWHHDLDVTVALARLALLLLRAAAFRRRRC